MTYQKTFDNWIYYTICEKTLKIYERHIRNRDKYFYFSSYTKFCELLRDSIVYKNIGRREEGVIVEVDLYIKKTYGLNKDESAKYVANYFIENKWLVFENAVILMKEVMHSID